MNSWNKASDFTINDFSEKEAPDCWHWLLKKNHYHVIDGYVWTFRKVHWSRVKSFLFEFFVQYRSKVATPGQLYNNLLTNGTKFQPMVLGEVIRRQSSPKLGSTRTVILVKTFLRLCSNSLSPVLSGMSEISRYSLWEEWLSTLHLPSKPTELINISFLLFRL